MSQPGQDYYFIVRAVAKSGKGEFSKATPKPKVKAQTLNPKPKTGFRV